MPRFAPGKIREIIDGRDESVLFEENFSTVSQYDRWADNMVDALRPFVKR